VDSFAFSVQVVAPVWLEVAVGAYGSEFEYGSAPSALQQAPVMSIRSLTRWRHAPSMMPVAIGHPDFNAVG
jgi:hypothetical protein